MSSGMHVTPGAFVPAEIEVWYTGTDVLKPGYAVCRDVVNCFGTTTGIGIGGNSRTIPAEQAGISAAKPTFANLNHFLGVVAESNSHAQLRSGVAGRAIKVIPRWAFGSGVAVWCDESITLYDLLGIQPNSFAFIKGGIFDGVLYARAEETVDRSSTAGKVKCEFGQINISTYERASQIGEFVGLRELGNVITGTAVGGAPPWLSTFLTAGSILHSAGDKVTFTGGSAADGDGVQTQYNGVPIILTSTKKLYWECLVDGTNYANSDNFFGLCIQDTTIFASGAEGTQDYIGWIKQTGDGVFLHAQDKANGGVTTVTGATLTAGTPVKFGMLIASLASTQYINDTAQTGLSSTAMPIVGLTPSFSCKVNAAATAPTMIISRFACRWQL